MPTQPVWDEGTWTALPALVEDIRADVCVIGLGGSGLACIAQLQAGGLRVVGIDAGAVAGGAAGRNGGFLLGGLAAFYHTAVASLGRERCQQLYRYTLAELERMHQYAPDLVWRVGSLRIAGDTTEQADCAAQYAAMQADDLPVERYTGPEGQGLLFPADGGFQPMAYTRRVAADLLKRNVPLYEQTPVVGLAPGLVTTPGGRIGCEQIVVAVDGGLEQLVPELSTKVRSLRLQMLATEPDHTISIPRPVYYRWGYEYWQQLPDRRIVLGGFRDAGGADEWDAPGEPSEAVQTLMEQFLRTHVGSTAPVSHRWAARVAYREALLPHCAELRRGLWAIGGYNGTGNLVGRLCGRAIAEQILTGHSTLFAAWQSGPAMINQ